MDNLLQKLLELESKNMELESRIEVLEDENIENSNLIYELMNSFKSQNYDKVKKWILPVEIDGDSGEYYLQLPDDLLEQMGWKEGKQLEFVDMYNGTFEIRSVGNG